MSKRTLRTAAPKAAAPAVAAPAKSAKAAPEKKAAADAAEKPVKTRLTLGLSSADYAGPSPVTTSRVSRTSIDFSKFGTTPEASPSARDLVAVKELRTKFGNTEFPRADLDAGIIRRLGERGLITHVSGDAVSAQTRFKLTAKAASMQIA